MDEVLVGKRMSIVALNCHFSGTTASTIASELGLVCDRAGSGRS